MEVVVGGDFGWAEENTPPPTLDDVVELVELGARNIDREKIEIVTFGPYRRFSFFISFEDLCNCSLLNTGE